MASLIDRCLAAVSTACLVALVVLTATAARAQQAIPVKIGYYPGTVLSAGLFVADVKGFYKAEGLDAQLQAVQNGPLMNSQMGSGAIDFGYQPPSNVGLARERGLDQVFVASNVSMPWVLIGRPDLKLPGKGKYPDVIRDLKGLNWGVYGRGSDGEVFMRVMAGDAKLDLEKDMAWIGVGGPPTGLPALKARQIDVYLTLDPAPAVAEIGGYGQRLLDLSKGEGPADFKGIFYNGIVTLRKTAEQNPKATEAVARVQQKAVCWMKDESNLKELLALLKGKVPTGDLNDAQYEAMIRANLASFSLAIPHAHFKVWNDMLLRANVLKKELPPADVVWRTVPGEEPRC